ncbi:MAG: Uncharacterised protein [SAR116 cluster bacterium]|nr:MAG: Uncharacterised protein [SAR116 cluster bacterium]
MHANGHVSRAILNALIHHIAVFFDQPVRVLSYSGFIGTVFRVTQIGEKDVIQLQITAACIIKGLNRLLIGLDDIIHQMFDIVAVGGVPDIIKGGAEMATAGSGNGNFWPGRCDRCQIAIMVQHRMIIREIQRPVDGGENRAQLHAGKLHTFLTLFQIKAGQATHIVIMPEGPPRLAIGDNRHADRFLHFHKVNNGLILDFR